jgi:cell division protein FtsL
VHGCGLLKKYKGHRERIVPMRQAGRRQIQRRRVIGLWIFIMAIFITELLVYTWSRLQCIQIGYEISNEAKKRRERISIQKNLKIELATLKSPKRISKIARERLKMAPPSPEQIISIP